MATHRGEDHFTGAVRTIAGLTAVWFVALGFCAAALAQTPSSETDAAAFDEWLQGFKREAISEGVSAALVDRELAGLSVNERVFELNDNQPEFSRAIWDYLDSAVSETRLANGREGYAREKTRLAAVEEKYGVDAEILVAIWGLESAYGAIMGDHDAIRALATLAWKGRRTSYGRGQLIGALKILDGGYARRDELKGSWAGAMGQTQFIPTTYLAYAVDADGDGRRDIWSNLDDVFSSTANYLSKSGYRKDAPWGVEVKLPANFDFGATPPSLRKPVAAWASAGLRGARADLLEAYDLNAMARLITPAGARGPAFLVFSNFDAILKYNRSTAYALAVGMLSDGVAGSAARTLQAWPRDDRALSLSERKDLQASLKTAGFDPGPADGVIGANTKKALRAWQKSAGVPADGYASATTLEALKDALRP
ncbi:MAG: lytic murein transglycosylase [Pseudomonadota bacterium]